MPVLLQYPDRTTLMRDLAEIVADQLAEALEAQPSATMAVPGGTTPAPFFEALSKFSLDWARVIVMPTDERCVPADHPRSNARLIRQTLQKNKAAAARFQPLDLDDVDDVQSCLPLDVLVLGMGADMHTASLFPDAPELATALADNAPPLVKVHPASQDEPRLTLSAPALRSAKNIHLLITGKEKQAALGAAFIEGPVSDAPVRAILSAPNHVDIHYAD